MFIASPAGPLWIRRAFIDGPASRRLFWFTGETRNGMDPNANLDEQLELVKQIKVVIESNADWETVGAQLETLANDLVTRVEALDHWITGGGFIPDRWNRPGTPGGLYVGKDRD